MARRGFFAELHHHTSVAAKAKERSAREAYKRQIEVVKRSELARRASERARTNLVKAADSDRKKLEKEAREAHLEAMEAEVIERNGRLEQTYEDIDSLLASTLKVDDYVNLDSLRAKAIHPRFDRFDLETPCREPTPLLQPSQPILSLPASPTGLSGFFGKKKHAAAVETAKLLHERALLDWHAACHEVFTVNQKVKQAHVVDEGRRKDALKAERARYAKECSARESKVADNNSKLDELIVNLGYGTFEAIQEYVSIVLSNSVYPDHFQAIHDFEFDSSTAELCLRVMIPAPADIPTIKCYKYTKVTDEITSTALSQKECRERYANAVQQVALRSFHEVFESDRRGLIKSICLEVGTNTIDRAIGLRKYVPLVFAAAERELFLKFELSAVVPALTLGRLGAAVSKNPFNLDAAERSGVRRL